MSTGAGRRVLVVGLDPYRVPGPWDPEPVATAVAAGMAALLDEGYVAEACLVGLDGSDAEGQAADALREAPWDCVLVGGGLRHGDDTVELFEAVVDLVRRHAPQARIAFNSRPDDLAVAVTRALSRAPQP